MKSRPHHKHSRRRLLGTAEILPGKVHHSGWPRRQGTVPGKLATGLCCFICTVAARGGVLGAEGRGLQGLGALGGSLAFNPWGAVESVPSRSRPRLLPPLTRPAAGPWPRSPSQPMDWYLHLPPSQCPPLQPSQSQSPRALGTAAHLTLPVQLPGHGS